MTTRGRGAQAVRPGIVVKSILLGELPLLTKEKNGEIVEKYVTEATATDLQRTYKALTRKYNVEQLSIENERRRAEAEARHEPRPYILRPIRAMSQGSFAHWFKFLRKLGMIELVDSEPMIFGPPGKSLLQIVGRTEITESLRHVYRLSELGRHEEAIWQDVSGSYNKARRQE